MKIFKVGFIGFGYWGKILFNYFENHEGFKVIQITTRNPKKIVIENKKSIKITCTDELFKNKDVDVVVITTPIGTHFSFLEEALIKNKNIFCEKPLTVDYSKAKKIYNLCDRKNLKIFTDYIFNYSPSVRKMIDLVKEGAIGKIKGYYFRLAQLGHFSNSVYWDLGCHILSIVDNFIPLDKLVFSKLDIYKRGNLIETGQINFSPKEKDIKGGKGSIFLSFNHPIKERNMTIYGEKGTLMLDITKKYPLTIVKYDVLPDKSRNPLNKNIVKYNFDEMNTLKDVVEAFYNILIGQSNHNIDMALRVTKVLGEIEPFI